MIEKIVKYNMRYGTTTTTYKVFGKTLYTRREYKNNDPRDGDGGGLAAAWAAV